MEEEVSTAEAFRIAFERHCAGDLAQAAAIYRAILDAEPGRPDTLHHFGILLHQRGDSAAGLDLIRQSLAAEPGRADWHNNLGNILFARGELQPAAEAFRHAVNLQPADAMLWNNLGAAQRSLGQDDAAEQAFRQAIAANPVFADALNNLGSLLEAQGRSLEAAEYYCRAYVLEPTQDKPKSMLGIAYYKLGRLAEAAEVYRQWLLEEPGNPVAAHFLAACSGKEIPARCSEAFIEKTFDEFAARFDEHLQGLSYQGPQMMGQLLERVVAEGSRLDILDAGCGTGLCGPVLAPYARSLTGIDLSEQMLQHAQQRAIYHALEKADLTQYLEQHPASFDLIAAADTLIYFGDLLPLFAAAHGALRPNGLLAFSIELEPERSDAFRLNPHGRYSHGADYVAAALQANGFSMEDTVPGIVRIEFGTPVAGLAIAARRQ